MAGHEARLLDEVRRADRARAEAQVRHRDGARLLRVVDEVALRVGVRLLADDLDRVLVRADRAVRAEPEEHGALHVRRLDVEAASTGSDRCVTSSVIPTVKGCGGSSERSAVEHRLHHRGGELLRREPVAPADHPGARPADEAATPPLVERRQRRPGTAARRGRPAPSCGRAPPIARALAGSADRKSSTENGRKSRTLRTPTRSPRAASHSTVSPTVSAAGAHHHDDALGLGVSAIVEQTVRAAGQGRRSGPWRRGTIRRHAA